jgi:hypothetical protein
MKSKTLLLLSTLFMVVLTAAASANETYFKFNISSHDELELLTRVISIDNVIDGTVFAYANDEELKRFESLGYSYTVLPRPSTLITPKMSSDKADIAAWDSYPTYDAYEAMMSQFASNYPDLCRLVYAGYSVQGRQIIFAVISDNVNIDEDEPEVMYTSSMHGDEITAYVLMLRLIDSLLTSYGSDSLITRLVDSCEIWINPLANPDGTYASGNHTVSGATRYNANSIDINRNFPDPDDGQHPDGNSWQPETVVMMNLANNHNFVISSNFHGGAEVLNYPWDTWSKLHADNQWFIDICRMYADTAQHYSPSGYMNDLNNGITNGYAWYTITGGRQDYMNYWHHCREVTLEISSTKLPSGSQLPNYWNYNRIALLDYLENALYGIRGIITDANTGQPVHAKVRVLGHDFDSSEVYSDAVIGNYHRMIDAGTYNLEFSAPGYYSDTIISVVVTDFNTVRHDIALVPLPVLPDLAYLSYLGPDVDPGDNDVSLYVTLVNSGPGNANNASATLSTTDPYITIDQNYTTFPTITALGGTGTSQTALVFDVSPSCPLYHEVSFRLDVSADLGYNETIYFSLFVGQSIENFETGDFSSFAWQSAGNQPWQIVSFDPYEGTYCARSGAIGNSQTSEMRLQMTVTGSGTISFYYKVSSESGWDYLKFYMNSSLKGQWSGEVGWTKVSYNVAAGTYTFKWIYTKDSYGASGSDCAWVDKIIFPPSQKSITITTVSLPDWTVNVPYSQQLQAEGGTGTLTWSDKNGNLSGTGLSISTNGLVSGTPVSSASISFTARVVDSESSSGEKPFSFTINPAPTITTASELPQATRSAAYSIQLAATGGTGTKIWGDKFNQLTGTGLTLNATGLVSGTPLTTGTVNFTAVVSDTPGASTDKAMSIYVNPAVDIVSATIPDWTQGVAFSSQLEATGGTAPLTWDDKNGSLAAFGLSLSAAGLISGTPGNHGPVSFTARVTDVNQSSDEQLYNFTLNAPVEITSLTIPSGAAGEEYSFQLTASGGTGILSWLDQDNDLAGSGVMLASSGLLSGTPLVSGTIAFTAYTEDQVGSSDTRALDLIIGNTFVCGDVTGEGDINLLDILFLIDYVYGVPPGPAPDPLASADINSDLNINLLDILGLIDYIYSVPPGPAPNCP